jgi:hypothetical protein
MNFPADHPEFPDMPKGMRQVLIKWGLWKDCLCMDCKTTILMPQAVVPSGFLTLISKSSDHLFKKLLRLLDICAYFCWNSTVNLILWSFSGVQSNSIFVSTVITLSQPFRKISWRLLHQLISKPFGIGSFERSAGWKLTSQGLEQGMLKSRWRNLVPNAMYHTDESQKL